MVAEGWKEQARLLLDDVARLRSAVRRHGKAQFLAWRPRIERKEFAVSACNFAHYLAFRRHNLQSLQHRLMALGLSSLGRSEGRVLSSLDSVSGALAAMIGGPGPTNAIRMPSERQFFRGDRRLAANAEALFGPSARGRSGRVLVTLGTEAADDPTIIDQIVRHGADAVRINCAHDNPDRWAKMIEHVRTTERDAGRRICILMDIAGPKVRTIDVAMPPDRNRLKIGDDLVLCRTARADDGRAEFRTGCTLPTAFDHLDVGDPVSIDDGKLRGTIVRRIDDGFVVHIEEGLIKGIKLKAEKGLNFPNVDLGLDPLTDKDKSDLDFVVHHADMIGFSFVRNADDVSRLQIELASRRKDWQQLGIVAKIETPEAVANLPGIIVQAAGHQPLAVMIARGDLAVELGFERVAEMQEEILWLCEAAQIPCIWATQVLEGLVAKGLSTRGEMTDAAMAARAECVMLNKGPNILAGISALDRILRRMGENQAKKTPTLRALQTWQN